jgi:hypothetical protein
MIIWLTVMTALLIELMFIFRPFELQMKKTLQSLESSINQLTKTQTRLLTAQKLAIVGDWELNLKPEIDMVGSGLRHMRCFPRKFCCYPKIIHGGCSSRRPGGYKTGVSHPS